MSRHPVFTRLDNERGLTLTELTIVGALAIIVMLALTVFYFNSQRMWLAGSTQALAQRDATLLVEEIRKHVNGASSAFVDDVSDPIHNQLTLSYADNSTLELAWNSTDKRIHLMSDFGSEDHGPIVDSPVSRFELTSDSTMVELTLAELTTADGDSVRISSAFALMGR